MCVCSLCPSVSLCRSFSLPAPSFSSWSQVPETRSVSVCSSCACVYQYAAHARVWMHVCDMRPCGSMHASMYASMSVSPSLPHIYTVEHPTNQIDFKPPPAPPPPTLGGLFGSNPGGLIWLIAEGSKMDLEIIHNCRQHVRVILQHL